LYKLEKKEISTAIVEGLSNLLNLVKDQTKTFYEKKYSRRHTIDIKDPEYHAQEERCY
jgi:hypothetical protein